MNNIYLFLFLFFIILAIMMEVKNRFFKKSGYIVPAPVQNTEAVKPVYSTEAVRPVYNTEEHNANGLKKKYNTVILM